MKFFLFLLGLISCISCVESPNYIEELHKAKMLMKIEPDSSLHILKNIKLPLDVEIKDNAIYCLLLVKAMDKTYTELKSDSIINIAFDYFKQTEDSSLIAESYFYKGRVAEEMENKRAAIEFYLAGKDFCNPRKDIKLQFLLHYYLGNLYAEQELFEEELQMQEKAFNYSVLLNDSLYISYSLCALGNAYNHIGMNNKAIKAFEEALLWVVPNDNSMNAYIWNSIGGLYNKIGDYAKAMYYAHKSEIAQKDIDELLYVCALKGHIYTNISQYDSAKYYYAKSIKSDDLYTKAASFRGLYKLEKERKSYKQAIFYNESYLLCRDSIEDMMHSDAVIKMRHIYHNEKLKEKNHLLQLAKIQADNRFYKLFILFILVLVALSFFYSLFKIKKDRKIHEQEALILKDEKKLQDYEIQQMKREKEIAEYKQKELSLREAFYKKLISVSVPKLKNTRKEERIKLSEADWSNIIENVDIAFNGFSKRLLSLYPKLTTDDIRLCALLKMNLPISDLSSIYCIEKISIYKKKERIKKLKMDILDSTIQLDDIIHNF